MVNQASKLSEIKPNKQPIGYYPRSNPFTNHTFNLQKGESIYLFTDGYADQFGGTQGKKFMYKRFQELLLAGSSLTLEEHKVLLAKRFDEWKGTLEQVDDVCVIGIKV